jgi:pyrroline-5-carboxylate reductase
MSHKPLNIALIGCGKMGGALVDGWLQSGIAQHIQIIDPEEPSSIIASASEDKISWSKSANNIKGQPDVCVIAVKPQIINEVCDNLKDTLSSETQIISIAAGTKISLFEEYFGNEHPITRVMPNTPASIGKGISVLVSNNQTSQAKKNIATSMMEAVGSTEWIDDESLIDAVTAVSGSGPAYIFLLIETLAKAGEKAGLSADMAIKLARKTVTGSAALAEAYPDISADTLRENVTSPGGTTEAALKILMGKNGLQELMDKAVEAATNRGKELGS